MTTGRKYKLIERGNCSKYVSNEHFFFNVVVLRDNFNDKTAQWDIFIFIFQEKTSSIEMYLLIESAVIVNAKYNWQHVRWILLENQIENQSPDEKKRILSEMVNIFKWNENQWSCGGTAKEVKKKRFWFEKKKKKHIYEF